jgi:hypothetical protein
MKYVLGLAVATLVILTAGYLWLFSVDESKLTGDVVVSEVEQSSDESQTKKLEEDFDGQGTMNDLLGRGQNIECQITTINNSVASEGTFFVADQKIRGDFITESPDLEGVSVSSIIIVDETLYVWTELDGESYGVKTVLQESGTESTKANEPVSLDEEVKYSCQAWADVDQSVFIPPTNVLFQDLSEMLQGGMEYGTVYEEGEF